MFIFYFTFVGTIYPRANSLNFQSRHDNNSISSVGLHSKNENADLDANFTLKLFKEFIKSNKYHIVSFLLFSFLILVLVRKTSLGGYSRIEIEKKAKNTEKILELLSHKDNRFNPQYLKEVIHEIFVKLQQSWQDRNYESIKGIVTDDFYKKYSYRIEFLRKERKINVIENVEVLSIDIIRVIYKAEEKRIIALISARMKDYYVDESNGKIIELNDDIRFFQEFWGFCLHNDRWVLEYIKQIGEDESLVLANEVD